MSSRGQAEGFKNTLSFERVSADGNLKSDTIIPKRKSRFSLTFTLWKLSSSRISSSSAHCQKANRHSDACSDSQVGTPDRKVNGARSRSYSSSVERTPRQTRASPRLLPRRLSYWSPSKTSSNNALDKGTPPGQSGTSAEGIAPAAEVNASAHTGKTVGSLQMSLGKAGCGAEPTEEGAGSSAHSSSNETMHSHAITREASAAAVPEGTLDTPPARQNTGRINANPAVGGRLLGAVGSRMPSWTIQTNNGVWDSEVCSLHVH